MECPFELPVKLRYGDLVELLGYTPHAKYVVQAINSHDTLLEACKETQKLFAFIAENYKSAPHFPTAERMVETAIAQAEK